MWCCDKSPLFCKLGILCLSLIRLKNYYFLLHGTELNSLPLSKKDIEGSSVFIFMHIGLGLSVQSVSQSVSQSVCLSVCDA